MPVGLLEKSQSPASVQLGRHLFYDNRLSGNGLQSCSTCHQQHLAFTDGLARAIGSTGARHPRSSMSLTNVAYNASFTWADPRVDTLEAQTLVPLFNEHPVEMGVRGRETEILERLRGDARYALLFGSAFPGRDDPFTIGNIASALAAFERTLISGNSAWDRVAFRGESSAMTETAKRGMRIFFSERAGCSSCHQTFNFSGPVVAASVIPQPPRFHNTNVYAVGIDGRYDSADAGLLDATGIAADAGHFRAPTLRNIALTAPYMHDGSIATLGEVIDHYAMGGRASRHTTVKSSLVPFSISDEEKADLIAFLEALTDHEFVTDPRFGDPWEYGSSRPH